MQMNKEFELKDKAGSSSGILIEAFEVPGKIALWLEDESKGDNFGTQEGDTIGLKISSGSFGHVLGCLTLNTE